MSPGKGLKKLKSLLSSSLGSNALPSTPPSPAVRQLCRLRFFSLLQECSSRTAPRNPDGEQPAQKAAMDGTMESGDLWATRALDYGTTLVASSKEVRLDMPLGEEAADADATAAAALEAIAEAQNAQPDGDDAEAEDVRVRRLKGFEYLLVSMRLQLLDEQKETAEILQEIVQCFQHSAAQLGADDSDDDDEEEGQEEVEPVTVLVDCLLGLLTRPSALVREVVRTVFKSFTADVGEAALDLLLHALTAHGEAEEGDEPGGEDVDDLPEIGFGSDDEDDEDGDDEGDENEDEDDDDDEEAEGVTVGPAEVDSDEDMWDEEEDDDLDDSEMFRQGFNEKLAQILRLKKEQGKKSVQDRRRATAHWKLRILDLLELFMKREPRSELLLLLPQPLLECVQAPSVFKVRTPHNRQLFLPLVANDDLSSPNCAMQDSDDNLYKSADFPLMHRPNHHIPRPTSQLDLTMFVYI